MIMFFVNPAMAQDERFWRKLLTGELSREEVQEPEAAKLVFSSPRYEFDLDGDGQTESLLIQKRDGLNVLEVYSAGKDLLFTGSITGTGIDSKIYRLRVVDISKEIRSIIIYFFEGKTQSRYFEASARLYFLTFKKNKMDKMVFQKGPMYWHEYEAPRDQYWRRPYAVNVIDIDKDGVSEIFVNYNQIQFIWRYQESGLWKQL